VPPAHYVGGFSSFVHKHHGVNSHQKGSKRGILGDFECAS